MPLSTGNPLVSVIVPARNEEAVLGNCLRTLVDQPRVNYEVIVVNDDSSDRTAEIAHAFPVQVIPADPLPLGWSGKCNACWSGAKVAEGKWLLFTDADTHHSAESVATGLREAEEHGAVLLSYSPRQEVRGLAERALMPVIFAELARTYRPKEVSDPNSRAAAANGQYLLIRRDVYDAVGGHAAVAQAILEDVEIARRVKQGGYKLQFRQSSLVSTRMYRSFGAMWEGWTKNLALLFPNAQELAALRAAECLGLVAAVGISLHWTRRRPNPLEVLFVVFLFGQFYGRISRAHFGWLSSLLAPLGLPFFAVLLRNSYISHKRGSVRWKDRDYFSAASLMEAAVAARPVRHASTVGSATGDHGLSNT